MLAARSSSSVCLSCRLRLLSLQRRGSIESAARSHAARIHNLPQGRRPIQSIRSATQKRAFRSTALRLNAPSETRATPAETAQIPESPSFADLEKSVRDARQLFGDVLPREHLSDAEYTIYERLYGEPVLVDKVESTDATAAVEDVVVEEELLDGTPVLLRNGKDGELEEVEYHDERLHGVYEQEGEAVEALGAEDSSEAELEDPEEEKERAYHQDVYESTSPARWDEFDYAEEEEDASSFVRAHPLTAAGKFATSPSTIYLPKDTFVDPISTLLTRANHKHLAETAHKLFGGEGLPHSASTIPARAGKEQKPIPIDPSQSDMGSIAGDAYMAAVMPGTYASVMSTLVEVRKRLGSAWLERLMKKEGGPLILDAGSGGAGVVAWREVLQAEWQRMHEESGALSHGSAPLGKASVLAGSDVLRHRASRFLENTTFLPRLPDDVPTNEEPNEQQPRKVYDVIVAPHTLWTLRQEFQRREMVQKLWSLLNPDGGVLILIEKGLPRGFEVIAAARDLLLNKYIASSGQNEIEARVQDQGFDELEDTRFTKKETGMIVAPCTNHTVCPMYHIPGVATGRKDFCYFSQRYIRPPYLQRILDAKDRNHEDVQFSYIAVQRGRDQRLPEYDILGKGVVQGEDATLDAFEGHEWEDLETPSPDTEPVVKTDVNPLALPRMLLPALKRRGHVILDLCTPSGTLERWTVPKSFSKQAYRDARKSRWGDLWALGAKTRIPRNVRLGKSKEEEKRKGRKMPRKDVIEVPVGDSGVQEEGMRLKTGGRYTKDRRDRKTGRKGRKQKAFNLLEE